jgi:mannose-6-phosphate isomerase-like protein (cupin superfamily)
MAIRFLHQGDLAGHELVGDDIGGIPASVIFIDMEPGRGPRLHRHAYAELFFVLAGEATFTDGESHRAVGPGGVVVVPAGQPHGFVNSGEGRLRQIAVHLNPRFVTEWLDADE